MKIVVDFGCGNNKINLKKAENYFHEGMIIQKIKIIGIDNRKISDANIITDLKNKTKFQDNYADVVYSAYLLEEMEDSLKVINEMVRITKSNGLIHLKLPHYTSNSMAWKHIHKGFSIKQFEKIPNTRVEKIKLNYMYTTFSRFFLKEEINKIISFFANLNPKFCERFWIYWVGGFSELEIKLRKV
jgi:predicted SAM-dependent methyltransferase